MLGCPSKLLSQQHPPQKIELFPMDSELGPDEDGVPQSSTITPQETAEDSAAWDMVIQMPSPPQANRIGRLQAPVIATAMSSPRSPPSPLPGMNAPHRLSTQKRTASASQVSGLLSTTDQTISTPTTFEPPLRSIFSSGPAISSVSASTARASLSAMLPSSKPLSEALNNASGVRRQAPRSIDLQSADFLGSSRQTFLVPEKDVDDPSSNASGVELNHLQTSNTISRLFVANDSITPGALSPPAYHSRSLRSMNDSTTLAGHLMHRGFIDGRHSDIVIRAFGHEYKLHKLILDRVPFFASAFSGAWAESRESTMQLYPEDTDSNITRSAFELALKRIYGTHQPQQEDQEAVGLFATACWLDMADLVNISVDSLLRQMHLSKLDMLIKLVTNNYYGKAGDRILSSAKAMLCREGWDMPYEYWDLIPAEIIREIIGGDPFYVPGEWERWYLALRLLNRRLKFKAIETGLVAPNGGYLHSKPNSLKLSAVRSNSSHRRDESVGEKSANEGEDAWDSLYRSPDITPILILLDEGIHYVHLRFEQLQQIRSQKDILGVPVLPEKVISDALWMSMELRQRIVNAHESDLELGLSEAAEESTTDPGGPGTATYPLPGKGKQREGTQEDGSEELWDSWDGNGQPRKFWIPSNDISCIMGGSRDAAYPTHSTGVPECSQTNNRLSTGLDSSELTWAIDSSGLGTVADMMSGTLSRNFSSQISPRFSHYPPFRFSAEFPNPRTLKEKKRVYSQTVWYAGSMWNLYIQRVNTSKNQQLGIYLHRAKDKDQDRTDDPLAQFLPTVDDRIGQLEREMLLRKERRSRHWRSDLVPSGGEADREDESSGSGPEFDTLLPNGLDMASNNRPASMPALVRRVEGISMSSTRSHKTTQTPTSKHPTSTNAPSVLNQLLDSDDEVDEPLHSSASGPGRRYNISTLPPYVDGRPTIKTYFKIYSPSRAGRLLSIYESAPDRFNFSQSWGWKSSQMALDDGIAGLGVGMGSGGKDGKLRYMVVIGNV